MPRSLRSGATRRRVTPQSLPKRPSTKSLPSREENNNNNNNSGVSSSGSSNSVKIGNSNPINKTNKSKDNVGAAITRGCRQSSTNSAFGSDNRPTNRSIRTRKNHKELLEKDNKPIPNLTNSNESTDIIIDAPVYHTRKRSAYCLQEASQSRPSRRARQTKSENIDAFNPSSTLSATVVTPPSFTKSENKTIKAEKTIKIENENEIENAIKTETSASLPATSSLSPVPSPLPKGVIDLYPSLDKIEHVHCMCNNNHCSADVAMSSFLATYGKEYWQYLKDSDEPAIALPCNNTLSSLSSPSLKNLPADSKQPASPNSTVSQDTPEYRREWKRLNPHAVQGSLPVEDKGHLPFQPDLTPQMRCILVDWIIELSDHFDFGPKTLHLAITLVDKVLARGPLTSYHQPSGSDSESDEDEESRTTCYRISRERFQLLGACCTWVACKLEEASPPAVDDIAYVSDGLYSVAEIKRMERRVCGALGYDLVHHTPVQYAYELMRASHECPNPFCHSHSSEVFHQMVFYLLEIGRIPFAPATKKPSLLAASAVYLARVVLGTRSNDLSVDPTGHWTKTLQFYSGYSKNDLKETVMSIHEYHMSAEESKLKSVFAKYKKKSSLRVALKTVPNVEDLGF